MLKYRDLNIHSGYKNLYVTEGRFSNLVPTKQYKVTHLIQKESILPCKA